MIRAFNQVRDLAKRDRVDLRTAALMVRVAQELELRGFYP